MQLLGSCVYRLFISLTILSLPACTGIADPMIAAGLPLDGSTFTTDTRPVPGLPVCIESGEPASETHQAMFEALNAYRIENGLNPLIYSKRLEAAADTYAADLWQRGFFAHINPEGENPGDRAMTIGFCHEYVGENLAAGQNTVDRAMAAWIASPTHNDNMLLERYVYVGMGVSVDANGRRYWVQEFAYDVP